MPVNALRALQERLAVFAAERVRLELADVFIYLLRISDRLGIDLLAAADAKIALNERKYPPERVRGDARKYTEYD